MVALMDANWVASLVMKMVELMDFDLVQMRVAYSVVEGVGK